MGEREVDVRWLQPPEPFERIVSELTNLQRGERLRVLIHREPVPLLDMLRENRYGYEVEPQEDGTFAITIWEHPAS
jgi:uncharacterized protein (DUF2249 family)